MLPNALLTILCPACQGILTRFRPQKCPRCQCPLRFGKHIMSDQAVEKLSAVIKQSKFPTDAFEFIATVIATALAKGPPTRGLRKANTSAICTAAREAAQLRYRSRAIAQMHEWKLKTSFDIGELAFELAKAGWITTETDKFPESFRGIYEIGDASWLAPTALRGRCGKCDYDLRGTPTYICPECGARND